MDGRFGAKKNQVYTITLSDTPTVLKGIDIKDFFPYETASNQIDKLQKLIVKADSRKIDVKSSRQMLAKAKSVLSG